MRCGAENSPDMTRCGACSADLLPASGDSGHGHVARAEDTTAGHRFCVLCGRSIPFDAYICPYCGHNFMAPRPTYTNEEHLTDLIKILLYVLSAVVPLAGIIVGIIFLQKTDPEYKRVGKICLIIGLVLGVILPLVVMFAFFAAIWAM